MPERHLPSVQQSHYFTRRDPQRAMQRIIRHANALGFTVRFDPIHAA